ncbi:MAG: carboxypeptidase regulatory-like domain-containing protein, partial [Gammaproteobacteria bacterium]|nr:carboxypeptidase regulatory-like domain-containing protein [Gammaproteobacteria bacterium]
IQTDGQRRNWFWRGYAQREDAGYRGESSFAIERELHYAEAGWQDRRWAVSLVGRRERRGDGQEDFDYVKPALTAQPHDTVSFSVRPDEEGDYGYLVRWAPHARYYVNAFSDDDRDQVEFHAALPRETRMVAGWVREEHGFERRSLLAYRETGSLRRVRYGAGVLESEGRYGWLVEAGAQLGSGLYLSAQAVDDPLEFSGNSGPTLWMNLSIDLVNTGSGFTRASYQADYSQRGSISGRLMAPPGGIDEPLEGVPIRVDGEVRAYTDSTGGFHVTGLDMGAHRLELDEENLPLDTAPARKRLGVEVAAGRSTPVQIKLERRLGFAGRVLDAEGRALAEAEVVVLDGDGEVVARSGSDSYGYFRFSELKPGRYRLQLVGEGAAVLQERTIELVDRYVFAQDLVISP